MAIPSLAMIPSGYKDGKVYSVLPSNGDGDFTFSRGSNATRVNKDGLIETMPLGLGSELITNGGFATDSDWLKDTGWTISGGFLNCNTTISNNTRQLISGYSTSKTYSFTYTITNYVSGGLRVDLGYNTGTTRNANGTYTEQLSFVDGGAFNGYLRIFSDGASNLKIDNVSIKEVSSETPRLDYSDSSCPSLLLEPQRTNLVSYSEDLSDSSWSESQSSATLSNINSPKGTQNVYKFTENTASSKHQLLTTISSYTELTISFFAKKEERSFIAVEKSGWGSTIFDLNIGIVVSGTGNVIDFGNGWFKCSATYTASSAQTQFYILLMQDSNTNNYQGDGNSGLYLWGIQAEEGSYPTSYIPTNGATATRLADVCNESGNSEVFNSQEGILFANIAALNEGSSSKTISISDGSNNNNCKIYYFDDEIYFDYKVSGSTVSSLSYSGDLKIFNKVVAKYKANDFSLWVNGFEIDTADNGGVNPVNTFNRLNFDTGNNTQDFYGKTKQLQYYNSVLTDSELEELTSWESFLEMAAGQNYTIK